MKRATVWLLTMALFLTMLGGCRTADKADQTQSTGKENATTTTTTAVSHSEGQLASHITITSGDTTIRPYSRMTWSRIDNGDGTYEEMIADHCDPVSLFADQTDHIPTLTVKDDASYSTSANGRVEAVYLYSPVGDTYVSEATAWNALAGLPGGTYYVMLAVLLGGNCNP